MCRDLLPKYYQVAPNLHPHQHLSQTDLLKEHMPSTTISLSKRSSSLGLIWILCASILSEKECFCLDLVFIDGNECINVKVPNCHNESWFQNLLFFNPFFIIHLKKVRVCFSLPIEKVEKLSVFDGLLGFGGILMPLHATLYKDR